MTKEFAIQMEHGHGACRVIFIVVLYEALRQVRFQYGLWDTP